MFEACVWNPPSLDDFGSTASKQVGVFHLSWSMALSCVIRSAC